MTARTWIAALFAVLALVAPAAHAARAATPSIGKLTLKEKMSQRLVCSGRGADRTCAVADRRKLKAQFDMQVDVAETASYTTDTRVSFRIGTLLFDAKFGDAPDWSIFRHVAKIPMPGPTVADPPVGYVFVTWTGRHTFVKIKAKTAAVLGAISPPSGTSGLSVSVDSAVRLGSGAWFYAGSAHGSANKKQKKSGGDAFDLVKASVSLSGLDATLSDDRKPPTVQITSPSNNQFLGASPVAVRGTASDDRRIARVSYAVDDAPTADIPWVVVPGTGGATDERATFQFDIPVAVEGLHTVEVCVYDDAGNSACGTRQFVYSVSRPSLLAVGDRFAVAVRDGATLTWGRGVSGQLGGGSLDNVETPAEVPSLAGAVAVAAGLTHTVVLFSNGTVKACGSNAYGQLGDGTRDDSPAPVAVSGLTNVVAIAAGNYHSVALLGDGTVWSWGANGKGQIGDGGGGTLDNSEDRLLPVRTSGIAGAAAISSGGEANVVLLTDGRLFGWGDANFGQVPGGFVPQQIAVGLTNVVEVAVGGVHALARKGDGTVWAWGYRLYGSIGDGSPSDSLQLTPTQVPGVTDAIGIAASASASYALRAGHTIVAWGDNEFGEIGDGSTGQRNSPYGIPSVYASTIVRIASSGQSVDVLAERADKSLLGWGRYAYGDPLSPNVQARPVGVPLP